MRTCLLYTSIPKASKYAYKLPVNSQEAITTIYSAKEDFLNAAKGQIESEYGSDGDVAKTWSRRAVNGGALSADEYQTLTDLYGYAQDLSGGLYTLSNDLTQRSYSWANISNDSGKILDNSSLQSKYATLSKLSDPFSEYPTLIYDGPFSEHMTSAKPKGLTGNILSRAECQEKAVQLFAQICNCPVQEIKVNNCGENSYRNIETFCFTLSRENVSAHLDLTKTGGSL